MTDPHTVTAAILAGGQGRRMGAPKDRLSIRGRPILLDLLDRISHQGPTLLVASPARPRPVGCGAVERVVLDAVINAGPLAGVAAALSASQTPIVVVLSIDMPHISGSQLQWLTERLQTEGPGTLGLMLRRQDGDRTRIEPFPAVYRRSALPVVQRRLDEAAEEPAAPAVAHTLLGRWSAAGSLHALSGESGFKLIDAPRAWPAEVWLNLNRPEDLAQICGEIT